MSTLTKQFRRRHQRKQHCKLTTKIPSLDLFDLLNLIKLLKVGTFPSRQLVDAHGAVFLTSFTVPHRSGSGAKEVSWPAGVPRLKWPFPLIACNPSFLFPRLMFSCPCLTRYMSRRHVARLCNGPRGRVGHRIGDCIGGSLWNMLDGLFLSLSLSHALYAA